MKPETWFFVVVTEDGSLVSYNQMPEEIPTDTRPATNYDIYQAAKQIVEEFEQERFAARVTQAVLANLRPATPKVSDKVAEALKERGINPESVSTDA